MANVYKVLTHKGIDIMNARWIRAQVTLGDTYATASGGFPLDLATILAAAGIQNGGLAIGNVVDAFGYITTGAMAHQFAKGSGTAATIRFFNGTTEISDGAISSGTLTLFLLVDSGG